MAYVARQIINGVPQGTLWSPNSNTKGYWPLSDDLLDYSGNNHTLQTESISGSTAPEITVGKFGSGRYFSDSPDGTLLWCNNSVITDLTTFTVSFWMKSQKGVTPIVGIGGWNEGGIIIGESFHNAAGGLMPSVGWLSTDDSPVISNDGSTWTNLICTRSAGNTQFFTNGVAGATVYTQTPNSPANGWIQMGRYADTTGSDGGNKWKGTLCEVIIEDRAWDPSEITNYYNLLK